MFDSLHQPIQTAKDPSRTFVGLLQFLTGPSKYGQSRLPKNTCFESVPKSVDAGEWAGTAKTISLFTCQICWLSIRLTWASSMHPRPSRRFTFASVLTSQKKISFSENFAVRVTNISTQLMHMSRSFAEHRISAFRLRNL
jgi:hypothetical protein